MKLLLINSAESNSFVALFNGSELNVKYSSEFLNSDSARQPDYLINCLSSIADKFKQEYKEINAIAVTIGPGSFTGIRVGISIAKGAAAALDVPIIPLSNFELIYSCIPESDPGKTYCILIPAKLPEYYYSKWKEGKEQTKGCVEFNQLFSILDEKTTIVSNFDNETNIKHSYFDVLNVNDFDSEANVFLGLAKKYYDIGTLESADDVEPLYMKDFIAKKQN